MKVVSFFFSVLIFSCHVDAQEKCATHTYTLEQFRKNPSLKNKLDVIENYYLQKSESTVAARIESTVITIPVVVHILYHDPSQKINDAQVIAQVSELNKYFRRQNADTVNTPAVFKNLGADCEIEFRLATSDPGRRNTNGITRKYTPVNKWMADDKMKFSSETGTDVWDPKSYLNIWVCNLDKFAGYSSVVGGPDNVDGIVIGISAFVNSNKTIVHETGHWLNLKHLWGDENCGDDGVSDTPKQASYTIGCPTTVRITCNNAPAGDMYMNYMDFTNDACINMFTLGQKARMRALLASGGVRNSLLQSKGLDAPLFFDIPVPVEDPKWLQPKFYPNPAKNILTIDLAYDYRWIGKTIFVTNLMGQSIMNVVISSKVQTIDISRLQPGMYILAAKREDGVSIKQNFVKL